MIRYDGRALGPRPRIALVTNDALGNYVVVTPLLQALRAQYPDAEITYFAGARTAELWTNDRTINHGHALFGGDWPQLARDHHGVFDWVINVDSLPSARAFVTSVSGPETFVTGPALASNGRSDLAFEDGPRGDLWRDQAWIAADVTERYPFLSSGFIGEMFVRLAYLDGPVPAYRVPTSDPGEVSDVLFAMSASLPEKLWPLTGWQEIARRLRAEGKSVGLLGAPPKAQSAFWKGATDEDALVAGGDVDDLRGRYRLPEVAGALAKAKAVFTLDNGILHLAAAGDRPTVGLFRHGIHRLWTPTSGDVRVLTAGEEHPVSEIDVDSAWEAIRLAL